MLCKKKGVDVEKRGSFSLCIGANASRKRPGAIGICDAKWEGRILTEEHGENGFSGYDPVFFVPEDNCASAELESS